MKARRTSSCS